MNVTNDNFHDRVSRLRLHGRECFHWRLRCEDWFRNSGELPFAFDFDFHNIGLLRFLPDNRGDHGRDINLTTLLEPVNPGIKGRNLDVVLLTPFVVCQTTLVAFGKQSELFLGRSPLTAHIRGSFRFANQNACYLAFCKVKCLLLIFYILCKMNALRVYIVRLRKINQLKGSGQRIYPMSA